ncbi:hypothetical protein L596_006159 [Steinernema carpocapsae]|uniref:Uncharacterized protein n=1 Tax=Steinernema carpocapsae TaxID=34508 RepID=A0A4U8V1H8_STECR|nr:hypothetical protein L596_006159 [Steinernema carpocapsae]
MKSKFSFGSVVCDVDIDLRLFIRSHYLSRDLRRKPEILCKFVVDGTLNTGSPHKQTHNLRHSSEWWRCFWIYRQERI